MSPVSPVVPQPRYQVLGALTVTTANGSVLDVSALGGHRQAAVLAALLVHANRPVTRDRLVDSVWGEDAPPTAAATLQSYISHLRRRLEPGRSAGDPSGVIVRSGSGYSIRVESDQLDALRFEQLVAQAGDRAATSVDEPRRLYTEALRLWHGPALADFLDEPFAQPAAHRWESLRITAAEELIDLRLVAGEYGQVIAEVEALLREHRLRERLWGQLMLAQYRSGRQSEALQTYQRVYRLLTVDLGLEPGPELQRLEQQILTHTPQLRSGGMVTSHGSIEPAVPRAPIVGRGHERARFSAAVQRARAGHGSLLLVEGEAGVGKTRLLEAVLDETARVAGLGALGRCFEGGGAPPYWPWARIMREIAASEAGSALLEHASERNLPWRSWLPELGQDGSPARSNPHLVAEAIATLCRELSRTGLLVIALDDLHGADPDSLTVLSLLAGEPDLAGTVIVGAYRNADVPADHALVDLLATVTREPAVERLALSRLGSADVAELVEKVTGEAAAPEVAAEIHSRSSGNALFAIELVRLLRSEPHSPDAKAIPPGVRDVIRRRVARLPTRTRSLLSVAAVFGRDFELSSVNDVTAQFHGRAASDPVDDIEFALAAQLVEQADPAGSFRFSHALVQEALAEAQTALRRAHLHGAIADRLEARHGDDPGWWTRIAHHAVEAVPLTGAGPALAPLERAAEQAAAVAATRLCVGLRERRLALILSMPPTPERDDLELSARVSLTQAMVVEGWVSERIESVASRMIELVGVTRQEGPLIAALIAQLKHRQASGRFREAEFIVQQVDVLAGKLDSPLVTLCSHLHAGIVEAFLGRLGAAEQRYLAGEALLELVDPGATGTVLEPPGQQSLLSSYWGHRAWLTGLFGQEQEARDQVSLAVTLATRMPKKPFSLSLARILEAILHYVLADPPAALISGREAVARAQSAGYQEIGVLATSFLAWGEARTGQAPAGAVRAAVLALPPAVRVETLRQWAMVADAELHAGLPADALDALDRALEASVVTGARMWLPEVYRLRSLALRSLGRHDAADEALDSAADLAWSMGTTLLVERIARTRALPASGRPAPDARP